MKWFLCLCGLLLLTEVILAVPPDFVYTQGTHLMLNGKPFYFGGANTYDIFTYGSGSGDPETQYMDKAAIDAHMKNMQDSGVRVVRLWAFSMENWHGFEPQLGQYNPSEFAEFDYIIQSAKAHNIKLIATLDNYWTAYGGITQRLQWAGVSASPNQGVFFSTEKAIQSYLNYVKYFLNRVNHYSNVKYVNESTILAWELMNEPRHQGLGDDQTSKTLRDWVDRVGAFIKNIDPDHLISSGLEGHGTRYGYGGDEGNDFIIIHQSPYIDFCSVHPYPTESWANLNIAATQALLQHWISDAHNIVKKPIVVAEFNVDKSHGSRSTWWSAIYDTIENQDAAGDCFWWYENRNADGEYGVMKGDPELSVFTAHAQKMAAKSR